MPRLYSEKRHERELAKVREEYDGRLKDLQAALAELKEENRRLAAETALLEAQKASISEAMIAASEKRGEMQREFESFVAAEKALAVQAAEKAQALLEDVRAAYPNETLSARFSAFERRLGELFGAKARKDSCGEGDALFSAGDAETEEALADDPFLHKELAFSAAAPSALADGEWDLKEVLATLGLDD